MFEGGKLRDRRGDAAGRAVRLSRGVAEAGGVEARDGGIVRGENDALIHDTEFGDASLAQYQNYLVTQLPVVWQPNNAYSITEIRKDLKGVVPQNPLLHQPGELVLTKPIQRRYDRLRRAPGFKLTDAAGGRGNRSS